MFLIYFIILLLILYFMYLIIKFSGTEKPEYNLQYFRDNEYIKYPTIIVGYLHHKKIETEHFIATALDFVQKGFIKLEKSEDGQDYFFTIIKEIKATNIEIEALEIFFNNTLKIGNTQSLKQFKKIIKTEKIFGNYRSIKKRFNAEIREYFDKKQDVKKITNSTNTKNMLLCYLLFLITCYILFGKEVGFNNILLCFIVLTLVFSLYLITIGTIKLFLLGSISGYTAIIVTSLFVNIFFMYLYHFKILSLILILMAIIILFDDMLQRRKTNLANAYEMIKGLRKYIIDYSNIDEYDICSIYLWDYYFVHAVALNIRKI